jgi:hypothetical protein
MQLQKDKLAEAIGKGVAFLKQKIISGNYGLACSGINGQEKFSNNKGHLFSIFHLVDALEGELNEIERTIFLIRLLSEEVSGQWGYSPRGYYKEQNPNPFFVDSDDTAFALRIFRALNVYRANNELLKYLTSYSQDGKPQPAFSTFVFDVPERKLVFDATFENNFHIHPEVNANIYHTLIDTPLDKWINFELIKLAQKDDGSWQSFFYPNAYYSTWQFMSLLHKTGQKNDCFNRGIAFGLNTQKETGAWGFNADPYLSALALKTICLADDTLPSVIKATDFLLSAQNPDGSWITHQKIWVFTDNEGDVWQSSDNQMVISTALCVDALKAVLKKC